MAIGGKFDINAISAKIMNSRKVNVALEKRAKEVFEKNKKKVIEEFQKSSITQEIKAGPSSGNTSGALGGYGNLFSYIGFYSEEDPIEAVANYLKNLQFYGRRTRARYRRGQISVSYSIRWYDLDTIEDLSVMPWESGNSWIRGIEQGISGYSNYMYGTYIKSRSGKGQQTKSKVNLAPTFTPRRYLPTMIKDAERKMR